MANYISAAHSNWLEVLSGEKKSTSSSPPFTTPAHGTAFDIVGTNRANVQPALNALRIVSEMASGQSHRFA